MDTGITGSVRGSRVQKYSSRIKIGLVYFILLSGGLWHLLGIFQSVMARLAGPVIILLGLALIIEFYSATPTTRRREYVTWSLGVLGAGYLIEFAGTHTGVIFGKYAYGEILQPVFGGVPVAMSFAWTGMLLAAHGVVDRLLRNRQPTWLERSLAVAAAMVLFDLLLEQVAVSLHYWRWAGVSVPFRNYVAWFVMSLMAAGIGFRSRILPDKPPSLAKHVYFAQIGYFILVLIG